jgi:hypothetical protein
MDLRCGHLLRALLGLGGLALLTVSVAGAQAPDATVLVLQPADMPPSFKSSLLRT